MRHTQSKATKKRRWVGDWISGLLGVPAQNHTTWRPRAESHNLFPLDPHARSEATHPPKRQTPLERGQSICKGSPARATASLVRSVTPLQKRCLVLPDGLGS